MPACRPLVVILAGLVCGGFWNRPVPVYAQSLSADTGPQQMVPSGVPATYPSTSPSSYPSTNPANYPSTAEPAPGSPALTPYSGAPTAGLTGTIPSGGDGSSSPAVSGQSDVLAPRRNSRDPGPLYAPYGSPDAMTAARSPDANAYEERTLSSYEPWTWQVEPEGLMFKSYLAGGREPRMGSDLVHERTLGWLWDATVGGRVGILRYGTDNELRPQGWQLDIEGAAFPRLDLEHNEDLMAVDFRGGVLETTRQGAWEAKFGFYHISSHIGDEFLLKNPGFPRINYVRESLVFGLAVYLNPSLRLYSEAGWSFQEDGGAKPWEFQFGADFSPTEPTGLCGSPFFAINGHLRQENDFGGNLNVQTGWQWRGRTGHLLRVGMEYFNGMSDQGQFFDRFEEQIGGGVWYDY